MSPSIGGQGKDLLALLRERREEICERWLDAIVETYPAETAAFLKSKKNRFANPVGHTLVQGVNDIFAELIAESPEKDAAKVSKFLDNIIRVRAIQDFTPSHAVAFVLQLKLVVREALGDEAARLHDDLAAFDVRVDRLCLLAFDIYVKCREKLYEIKVDDLRRSTYNLLRMAKLVTSLPDEGAGPAPAGEEAPQRDNVKEESP
jgi:hypothetical protein